MSLKELTKERHDLAENTAFMKAVFNKSMNMEAWADFTYQKFIIYELLETKADHYGLFDGIEEIKRAPLLEQDALAMNPNRPKIPHAVSSYYDYLSRLNDPQKLMAHVYVWHMGDLYGGQMIKKVVEAPHSSLDFSDTATLKEGIRAKLDDSMGAEANVAFDWAIKILKSYDNKFPV